MPRRNASGAVLMLSRMSTEVIDAAWLRDSRTGAAHRIGAAGGRLLAPDGTVAGGAIVLRRGRCRWPGIHRPGLPRHRLRNWLQLAQTMRPSARIVHVSRLHFHEAGGFNAVDYPDCHADVDFCLRLRR